VRKSEELEILFVGVKGGLVGVILDASGWLHATGAFHKLELLRRPHFSTCIGKRHCMVDFQVEREAM
jgi:hypothetical protein